MSMIGKVLAHYEITSQLGKGGMGEVFRAKDQKLGRDVAIKFLPEEFARDADRIARFQREAKLLASLNHPNIAAIHGLEESGGTQFLVLELVEGETLADRIKAGPVAVEESLKLALQIAEALEAAHDKGVIHRDLKPANIKVTPEGKVKVLDFGLAKAFAGEQEQLNLSNSPTLSDMATQQGIILGTAAYMPPEQARGMAVDKRADIWAFGCVLYEMLTARQTWSGATVTDVIAAALAKDPDFGRLPPRIHPDIRKLLSRCLEKDPSERLRDIGDVRGEIKQILADPAGVMVSPAAEAKPRRDLRFVLPWAAAAVLAAAIITGLAVWKLKPAEPRPVIRMTYELPEGQRFGNLDERVLAVSPDGRQFLYAASDGLYLRPLDEQEAKLIPGTGTNPQKPFFSPDGKWIGYWSGNESQLKKIAVSGGAPFTLAGGSSFGSFHWGADGRIVFGQIVGGILQVSENGGTPQALVKTQSGLHPQILPGGKAVLYTQIFSRPYKVVVQSVNSAEPRELFPGDTARYVPTGHIVYASDNNLLAIPFDPDKLEAKGGSIPVVEGVLRAGGASQFEVSESGTLVYLSGTSVATGRRALVWVDRKGNEEPIAASPSDYRNPRISPDGSKLAVAFNSGGKSDIWIWDIVRENMTRLTFSGTGDFPLWTPDGKRIAFSSSALSVVSGGGVNAYWKAADGTGSEEALCSVKNCAVFPWSWSKDGKTLVLMALNMAGGMNFDIGVVSMEKERKWSLLLKEKHLEGVPEISPDGRWMAYMSDESGNYEVYVRPFPDVNAGRWQVSVAGGTSPIWSPDGRELFYRTAGSVVAVDVQTEPAFKAGKPHVLFQDKYVPLQTDATTWHISPDGKRFLMMKDIGSTGSTFEGPRKINIVVNWFEELKQLVPVR